MGLSREIEMVNNVMVTQDPLLAFKSSAVSVIKKKLTFKIDFEKVILTNVTNNFFVVHFR
jgi:hypothetical protein